jgi:ribA/ribD-fused uncharacterized protein
MSKISGDCVFFYSHNPAKYRVDERDNCVFSQWYCEPDGYFASTGKTIYDLSASFVMPVGERYSSAEKWMMLGKARMFKDAAVEQAILAEDDPAKIKALGRKISNYDDAAWMNVSHQHVVNGNYLKFTQNQRLRDILLATVGRYMVEATSENDKIWGIGFRANTNEERTNALLHRGQWHQNRLGEALNEVRAKIAEMS